MSTGDPKPGVRVVKRGLRKESPPAGTCTRVGVAPVGEPCKKCKGTGAVKKGKVCARCGGTRFFVRPVGALDEGGES